MDPLAVEVVGGLIVAVLSAIGAAVVTSKLFPSKSILPIPPVKGISDSYTHLEGTWQEYHITRDASLAADRVWLHGEVEWKITKAYLVEARKKSTHPTSPLDYVGRGEIRGGRLLLVGHCVQEPSDVIVEIFPTVYSHDVLVGIWVGVDFQREFTVAAQVYSRSNRDAEELNKIISASHLPHTLPKEAHTLIRNLKNTTAMGEISAG